MKISINLIFLILCLSANVNAELRSFSAASPKGKYIAMVKEKHVIVYESQTGQIKFKYKGSETLANVGFSNDESKLTFGDDWYTYQSYNLDDENTLLWKVELKEQVDLYELEENLLMSYSANDDYIVNVNGTEVVILDAYTGEMIGYQKLRTSLYNNNGFRLVNITPYQDNFLKIAYATYTDYNVIKMEVRGYGDITEYIIDQRNDIQIHFAKIAADNVFYYEEIKGKWVFKNSDDDLYKVGQAYREQLGDITFNFSGSKYVSNKYGQVDFYTSGSSKKSNSIKINGDEKILFYDDKLIVASYDYGMSFSTYNSATGAVIINKDTNDDFAYKGSAVALSKDYKEAGVIFFDDFDDNENGWNLGESGETSKEMANGKLILNNNSSEGSGYYTWNNKIAIDQFRDFEIETSVKLTGADKGEFGIFWDRSRSPSRYHALYLRAQDDYGVWEYSGFWISHLKYVKSEIVKDNDFNTLKVRKENNTYYYYVNDNLIYEMPFEGFHGSKAGFIYPANVTATIDFLKVSYLSKSRSSSAMIYENQFVENLHNWASGLKEGSYNQTVENGYYRYENMSTSTRSKWHNRIFLDDNKAWELEAALKFDASSSGYALALVWGRSTENSARYRFGISKGGKFVIDHYNGSKWDNLKSWTTHSAVVPNQFNKMKIVKKDKSYKFYINGRLVESLTLQYGGSYSHGPRVGFDIPPETVAHIDYIKARYINSYKTYNSCKYYYPFMTPKAKGNDTGRLLIGGIVKCNEYLRAFKGHSKNITYRQNVHFQCNYSDTKEEAELEWQKTVQLWKNDGHAIWKHQLGCFEPCN